MAVRSVGAAGPPITTGAVAVDGELEPAEFLAVTVNAYEVPFVSPFSVHVGSGTPRSDEQVNDFGVSSVVDTV